MTAWSGVMKYGSVARISLRQHLAYLTDFFLRTIFLVLILYIFTQLWGAAFHSDGGGLIAGYSLPQIIWYLIFTESMTTAFPSLSQTVEQEVKNGDIGYRLTRPMHYVLYHYAAYGTETLVRMSVNLIVGCLLGVALFGLPHFGWGWLGFALTVFGGITVNFLLNMLLALCAFWVEETRGLEFVYHKILFTIGGMLLPLEIYPEALQRVCHWLPFQCVLYFTAKPAVRFDAGVLGREMAIQWAWAAGLAILVAWVYAKGVSKLHVNGG